MGHHSGRLLGIPRGLTVEFRSEFGMDHRLVRSEDVERALDRARRLCICDGTLGYELDEVGRLVAPAAAARGDDPLARALLSTRELTEASSQIAIKATPAFFRTPGEATYVPVLFDVEPDSLSWSDGVAEVTVSGRVEASEGEPPAQVRLRVALTQDPDGRVRFDLPFALSPGRRELLFDLLRPFGVEPRTVAGWQEFLAGDATVAITVAPLATGVALAGDSLAYRK